MGEKDEPWRPPGIPGRPGQPVQWDQPGEGGRDGPDSPARINADVDLDELDPSGRSRRRAAARSAARPRSRWKTIMAFAAAGVAGTVLVVATTGGYVVRHLLGKVHTVNLDSLANRPPAAIPDAQGRMPLNILILGSQTRDGQNLATHVGNSGKGGTDLSDTAMLMHVSADRKWAEIVSIPRDLFVPIPACADRMDPSISHPAQAEAEFYTAMGEGGPVCAVATAEQTTNIRIDHVVELTFNAFIQLTDAVGGVPVCIPPPGIDDPGYSGLVLSAGLHTVSGNQALAFVRDRHGLSTGMDTERIRMQQMFMTSLFAKVTANGTLEDPVTLYKIANAVADNITVDTGLDNLSTMTSIAESVGTVGKRYMQYITAPYELDQPGEYDYDPDGQHSSPGPGFNHLWLLLRNDEPPPGSPAGAASGARAAEAGPGSPSPGTFDTESRNGDDGLCANLPNAAPAGGAPGQ